MWYLIIDYHNSKANESLCDLGIKIKHSSAVQQITEELRVYSWK